MQIKTGKKINKQQLDDALEKSQNKKVFKASHHKGKVKWGEEALHFQKRLRNEWD